MRWWFPATPKNGGKAHRNIAVQEVSNSERLWKIYRNTTSFFVSPNTPVKERSSFAQVYLSRLHRGCTWDPSANKAADGSIENQGRIHLANPKRRHGRITLTCGGYGKKTWQNCQGRETLACLTLKTGPKALVGSWKVLYLYETNLGTHFIKRRIQTLIWIISTENKRKTQTIIMVHTDTRQTKSSSHKIGKLPCCQRRLKH